MEKTFKKKEIIFLSLLTLITIPIFLQIPKVIFLYVMIVSIMLYKKETSKIRKITLSIVIITSFLASIQTITSKFF